MICDVIDVSLTRSLGLIIRVQVGDEYSKIGWTNLSTLDPACPWSMNVRSSHIHVKSVFAWSHLLVVVK